MNEKKLSHTEPLELAKEIVNILYNKKAHNIKLLHVKDQTTITDYFVICTGMSRTQIRALADEVEYKLSLYNVTPTHVEGTDSGIWVLEDFGYVILHVFTDEARDFYNLDKLYENTTPVEE